MGEGPISNNMLGMWKATPRRRDTSMNFNHMKLIFFCASPFLAETVLPTVCHRTACSAISQREFSLSILLSLIWRETKMPQNIGTAPARHKLALTHRLGRTQQEKHWKATGTGNLTEGHRRVWEQRKKRGNHKPPLLPSCGVHTVVLCL